MIKGSKSHLFREASILSKMTCLSYPVCCVVLCLIVSIALSVIIFRFSVCLPHHTVCFIWPGILSSLPCILEWWLVHTGYSTAFIKPMCKWRAVKGRGPCALNKILSFHRTFPIRGFQIYDGPIHLTRCTFKKYVPTPDRYTSAIGFLMKNSWQITPRNNISLVKFGPHVSTFLWFRHSDYGWRRRDNPFPNTKTQTKDLYLSLYD